MHHDRERGVSGKLAEFYLPQLELCAVAAARISGNGGPSAAGHAARSVACHQRWIVCVAKLAVP